MSEQAPRRTPKTGLMAFSRTIAFAVLGLGFIVLAVVAALRGVTWAVVATDLAGAVVFLLLARWAFPKRVPAQPEDG